jgi:hypothetical protein
MTPLRPFRSEQNLEAYLLVNSVNQTYDTVKRNKIHTSSHLVSERTKQDMIQKELFDQKVRSDYLLDGEKWIYKVNQNSLRNVFQN